LPHSLVPLRQGTGVLISSNLRERADFPELVPQVFNGVVARADLCGKKPTVCSRIVDGFVRGMVYMHDHPKESIDVLRKSMPDDEGSTLEEAYALMIKWTPRSGKMTDENWSKTQELALVAGMIKPEEKLASFKDIYTNAYVK
jgi:ABC-type nitrate/sulfonate/bicarbonate transport system substrate-binding protein